jgi:hypothetical protein
MASAGPQRPSRGSSLRNSNEESTRLESRQAQLALISTIAYAGSPSMLLAARRAIE